MAKAEDVPMGLKSVRRGLVCLAWLAGLLSACLAGPSASSAVMPGGRLVITNVNVITMNDDRAVLRDQTVIIDGGRIVSIGPGRDSGRKGSATKLNGRGKWLVPGFTDMHVHLDNDRMLRLFLTDTDIPDGTVSPEEALLPYVAHGVLQIVDMAAMAEAVGVRNDVNSGRIPGPRIRLAAMIDGESAPWPFGFTRIAKSPADARQAVRDVKAESYDFVKAYSFLTDESFAALLDEARRQGMRAVGHLARGGNAHAGRLLPGYALVTHAEEFSYQTKTRSAEDARRFAKIAKENGTALVTTLTLDQRILEQARAESFPASIETKYLNPYVRKIWQIFPRYLNNPKLAAEMESIIRFNSLIVRAFVEAGVPVFAGTDSIMPGVAPGLALHDELQAMAESGLTNMQVLEATTILPAKWLGTDHDRGSIEPGKSADLVLLSANPLEAIGNTRKIEAVIVRGRLLPADSLRRKLDRMTDRFKKMAQ